MVEVKEIKRYSHEDILLSLISILLTIGPDYRLKQLCEAYNESVFTSN
jgi:hypothetical protein